MDDAYGFGVSGSTVPTRGPREGCPICKKRYGTSSKYSCTCGVKKKGA